MKTDWKERAKLAEAKVKCLRGWLDWWEWNAVRARIHYVGGFVQVPDSEMKKAKRYVEPPEEK